MDNEPTAVLSFAIRLPAQRLNNNKLNWQLKDDWKKMRFNDLSQVVNKLGSTSLSYNFKRTNSIWFTRVKLLTCFRLKKILFNF